MTEEEARAIVLERIAQMGEGVQVSKEAIEAAVCRMLGKEPPLEPEPEPEEEKTSPFLAHTHGLHEKYFPDG